MTPAHSQEPEAVPSKPMTVEPGHQYLLDGNVTVTVLKALNRSKTMFIVETSNGSVESVAVDRLLSRPSHQKTD